MLCLSTFYYAWLAYRLAKKTGRTDVCALPSGISVPSMFVVTFVIMLPIARKTGNPIKGWPADVWREGWNNTPEDETKAFKQKLKGYNNGDSNSVPDFKMNAAHTFVPCPTHKVVE